MAPGFPSELLQQPLAQDGDMAPRRFPCGREQHHRGVLPAGGEDGRDGGFVQGVEFVRVTLLEGFPAPLRVLVEPAAQGVAGSLRSL